MPDAATPNTRRRRVPALAPDERRAALIAATVPLLRVHGRSVSTRQIAQAAGVAEGTIFGVFPDKNSLVDAALVDALDPAATVASLTDLGSVADLRARLTLAVTALSHRFRENGPLLAMVRERMVAGDTTEELRCRLGSGREKIMAALTTIIEPDAGRLRRSPATVARILLVLVGSAAYGVLDEQDRISSGEIVSLLLDGLLEQPSDTTTDGGTTEC